MSSGEKFFHLTDFVTDRLNPILVKETRQALKSRQFIITFMLLLTLAWLISVFGIVLNGPAIEYGAAGRMFFAWYAGVLGFATLFVVPFGAFRSMLNERDYNTFELLSISTLSPRQIVSGKLLSALVQVCIYYSAIAPFIAFTSLLQGFDLPLVVLVLSVGLLWSMFVSMVAIMLSTLSNSRQWQALSTIGMIALLLGQLVLAALSGAGVLLEGVPFDNAEFWWALCSISIAASSYLLLAQQVAVSRLTFESGNRSSGIRIISTVQFWLIWGGVLGFGYWYGVANIEGEAVFAFAMISSLHWLIAGLVFSTEPEHISRRVRRSVPQSRIGWLFCSPWVPGGRRGLLLLIVHLSALIAIGQLPFWPQWVHDMVMPLPVWDECIGDAITAMALYVLIYVGSGAAIGRLGQSITPEFRPAHARVLTLLLAALAMIAPHLPSVFGFTRRMDPNSIFQVTDPYSTLKTIRYSDAGWTYSNPELADLFVFILTVVAAVVLLINVRAILKGVTELSTWQTNARNNSSASHSGGAETAAS